MMFGFVEIFPVLFMAMFALVFIAIVVSLIKGASQWQSNNKSPLLTVEASVVTKRGHIRRYHNSASDNATSGHTGTTYYVTFQVSSGDRMELQVPSTEYGMLAEGDLGMLVFRGNRYQRFERKY